MAGVGGWWGEVSTLLSFLLPQGLQSDLQKTKEAFLENSTLSDQLPQPEERSTPGLHSGQRHSLQTAAYLEKMLLAKSNEFEVCLALPSSGNCGQPRPPAVF